jgi:RND superfamily putative drug exporter
LNRLFGGLGRFVVRYRYLVVLAWIVLIIVSARALPSLSSEVNNDNSQFLPASAPSSVAANLLTPLFGSTSSASQVTVVASDPSGPLTAADQAAIAREITTVRRVPRVTAARLAGASPSGQAVQVLVTLHVNQADVSTETTILSNIEATFAKVSAPPDLHLAVAGTIATNVASQQSSNKSGNKTQSLSLLLIIVLLLFIFRSLLAPIVTLLPAAVSLIVSMRFIGGLGAHGLKISEITELLLIVLLLGAGTDYGLFLVFRIREEMRGGREAKDAVVHSLVRVGESISASAGTVIFALLSLLLASFGIYKDLGIPLAVGVGVILLAGLTLLPALLAICGQALFWPSKVRPGVVRPPFWARITTRLVAKPALTLAIGVVIFGGLAAASLGYHSGGFGGDLNAPAGTSAAAGNNAVAKYFPGAAENPANIALAYAVPVWSDPNEVVAAEQSLRQSGEFSQLAGPFNPNGQRLSPTLYATLHRELGDADKLAPVDPDPAKISVADYNTYRSTGLFIAPDGKTIQFEASLVAGNQQSTPALDATPVVRATVAHAAAASGAKASGLAGEAAALYDVSSTSNHDLTHIVPVAIIAIAILLALVLRSALAPLYLIVSVALSYLAALGLSTLIFIDIGGEKGLTFILPFLMFLFLLALGEDYNILVMTRIREEAQHVPLREAVVRAVGQTGPAVTSAGLVLAGTFGVLAVAGGSGGGGSQIRDIGAGLAFGILMDTFLVRTLLVPSTVALLGRINWWPSKMGRVGFEPTARDPHGDDEIAPREPESLPV